LSALLKFKSRQARNGFNLLRSYYLQPAPCSLTGQQWCAVGTVAQSVPAPTEGDYIAQNFHFRSGEVLPSLRLHYTTFGTPKRDANGTVTNAVIILHGTTGSGKQFVSPQFAGVLFGAGQLLDAARYYIILPMALGMESPANPAMACTRIFRVMTTTTWCRRSINCWWRDCR